MGGASGNGCREEPLLPPPFESAVVLFGIRLMSSPILAKARISTHGLGSVQSPASFPQTVYSPSASLGPRERRSCGVLIGIVGVVVVIDRRDVRGMAPVG